MKCTGHALIGKALIAPSLMLQIVDSYFNIMLWMNSIFGAQSAAGKSSPPFKHASVAEGVGR